MRSILRGRRARVAAAAVTSAAALATFAPAASAASASTSYCVHINGGYGCYNPDGDYFSATDSLADGLSVITFWSIDYGRKGNCANREGAVSRVTCNESFYPNHVVTVRVALYRGSREVAKSDPISAFS